MHKTFRQYDFYENQIICRGSLFLFLDNLRNGASENCYYFNIDFSKSTY